MKKLIEKIKASNYKKFSVHIQHGDLYKTFDRQSKSETAKLIRTFYMHLFWLAKNEEKMPNSALHVHCYSDSNEKIASGPAVSKVFVETKEPVFIEL